MFYHVQALIKEARDQAKMLMEDAEREAREKYVVTVRPFGDADKYLLAGGRGAYPCLSPFSLSLLFVRTHLPQGVLYNFFAFYPS